jgi:hypothetical protein
MDTPTWTWRKSTFSGGNGGNCVELGRRTDSTRGGAVRDSKNPHGPVLMADLRAVLTTVQAGRFDR